MSKWMQFVFASYAPLLARFHLIETSDPRSAETMRIEADEAPTCASLPERRVATPPRRAPKSRKSMAA